MYTMDKRPEKEKLEYEQIELMLKINRFTDADLIQFKKKPQLFVKISGLFMRASLGEEFKLYNPFLGTIESANYYAKHFNSKSSSVSKSKSIFITTYRVTGYVMVLDSHIHIDEMNKWFAACLKTCLQSKPYNPLLTIKIKNLHILFRMTRNMVTNYTLVDIMHGYTQADLDNLLHHIEHPEFNYEGINYVRIIVELLQTAEVFKDKQIVGVSIRHLDKYIALLIEEVIIHRNVQNALKTIPDEQSIVGVVSSCDPTTVAGTYKGTILEVIQQDINKRGYRHEAIRSFAEIILGGEIKPYYTMIAEKVIKFYNSIIRKLTPAQIFAHYPLIFTVNPFRDTGLLEMAIKDDKKSAILALKFIEGSYKLLKTSIVHAPVVDAPVVDAPVVDAPVVHAPVVHAPVVDAPVVDAPVVDAPKRKSLEPSSEPSAKTAKKTGGKYASRKRHRITYRKRKLVKQRIHYLK